MSKEFEEDEGELPPKVHESFAKALRSARSELLLIALREVGDGGSPQ